MLLSPCLNFGQKKSNGTRRARPKRVMVVRIDLLNRQGLPSSKKIEKTSGKTSPGDKLVRQIAQAYRKNQVVVLENLSNLFIGKQNPTDLVTRFLRLLVSRIGDRVKSQTPVPNTKKISPFVLKNMGWPMSFEFSKTDSLAPHQDTIGNPDIHQLQLDNFESLTEADLALGTRYAPPLCALYYHPDNNIPGSLKFYPHRKLAKKMGVPPTCDQIAPNFNQFPSPFITTLKQETANANTAFSVNTQPNTAVIFPNLPYIHESSVNSTPSIEHKRRRITSINHALTCS